MNAFETEIEILQENLCDLRRIAGWTAESLANRLGVTKQTVSNLETQKVKMSRIQYIAIRAVFECEAASNSENTTLRKVLSIVLDSPALYRKKPEQIRTAITAIASIAYAGMSGMQLYASAAALLSPIGLFATIAPKPGSRQPSLTWLMELLEEDNDETADEDDEEDDDEKETDINHLEE